MQLLGIAFIVYTQLKPHLVLIAGEQERARRLILTSVVSSTSLKLIERRADFIHNVGIFLAFFCSSNWNEWYVSKRPSKGSGVEFKVRVRVM